jgi:excisionase family DNA binding protein
VALQPKSHADGVRPRLLTVRQTTQIAGCARTTLYRLISEGAIRPVKVGRRTLIVASELDEWIASLPRSTRSPGPR